MSRRDKRGRDAGSAQPRLRGCRKFATAGCLRRPYLFPCAGKDRGEKGAWGYGVHSASEFRRNPSFWLSFHTKLTSRAFWYTPPDTGVPNLQLVALEYLLKIEGADQICWSAPFCGKGLRYALQGRDSAPTGCTPKGSPFRGAGSRRLTERSYQICSALVRHGSAVTPSPRRGRLFYAHSPSAISFFIYAIITN